MAWQTPKTDWTIQPVDQYGRYNGDWFNWQDYERIRGNAQYLADLSGAPIQKMWTMDELVVEYPAYTGYIAGATITDRMRYAAPVVVSKQINPIERNLDILADHIYRPPDYPATKTWAENQSAPQTADLNRWESCLLALYNATNRIVRFKMPAPMGLGKGVF